jgi:hypothetical protein
VRTGHFALSLLVNEPRIDVAVALIGAGDYEQNMRVRFDNLVAAHASNGSEAPAWEALWPPVSKSRNDRIEEARKALQSD